MAFTGTATVLQVSDSIVRITGLSLAGGGASGIIGLAGHTGASVDVALPAAFNPEPYIHNGVTVNLSDMIDVTTSPATALADSRPPAIVKTGTTTAAWRATLTNTFASGTTGLEIYVKIHT
jgi:hypothetical protein